MIDGSLALLLGWLILWFLSLMDKLWSLLLSRSHGMKTMFGPFLEDLANKILQIPISRLGGDDFITWPHKIGVYTVQSAYFLACGDAALISRSGRGRGMSSGKAVESRTGRRFGLFVHLGR
jgi:hypothetical protein